MPRGTPQQISLLLQRRARALEAGVREADRRAAEKGVALARQYSSGPFRAAQLRAMGHPYATRAPRPPLDPALINRQTGRFLAAWRFTGPRRSGAGLNTRLVNDAPYARFLLRGTARMIARPLFARLRRPLTVLRARFLREITRRTLHS